MTIIHKCKQYTLLDNNEVIIETAFCAVSERIKPDSTRYAMVMSIIETQLLNDNIPKRIYAHDSHY